MQNDYFSKNYLVELRLSNYRKITSLGYQEYGRNVSK